MHIEPYTMEDSYVDMLNAHYSHFAIGDLTFTPAEILKNCKPEEYQEGLRSWSALWAEEKAGNDSEPREYTY